MVELRYYQHPDVPITFERPDGRLVNEVASGVTELQYRWHNGSSWGPWKKVNTVMGSPDAASGEQPKEG